MAIATMGPTTAPAIHALLSFFSVLTGGSSGSEMGAPVDVEDALDEVTLADAERGEELNDEEDDSAVGIVSLRKLVKSTR